MSRFACLTRELVLRLRIECSVSKTAPALSPSPHCLEQAEPGDVSSFPLVVASLRAVTGKTLGASELDFSYEQRGDVLLQLNGMMLFQCGCRDKASPVNSKVIAATINLVGCMSPTQEVGKCFLERLPEL